MTNLASALTGTDGERVALTDVSVSAVLRDLLAEVSVAQAYRNDERVNIEAVYTFPLPLGAVLLELVVEIGGRRLEGVVVEKREAEERYEDAVAEGDAAVMLSVIEPGLYTMNVGNLLPGETARITFRYAMLYRWSGERLRFFLPTTVAPRYGVSRHRPHEVPEAALTVENRFSLEVEIFGALRDAQFDCPSHPVTLARSGEKAVLSLQQPKAVMDRDFVLNVKAPQARRSFALCGADGDGAAALASFQPFFPGLRQVRPLNLAIVIDCSGSMGGDSIEQAKEALDGILAGLQPRDRMTIVRFGSTSRALSSRPLACNKSNLREARRFARQLDADMGGTEIAGALLTAYEVLRGCEAADVLLVTDGEVADWEPVVEAARATGHRIFTVGVGSAVSEGFVRQLASATDGGCELVSPNEGMAERIVRHFERMRAPRARRVAIGWPEGALDVAPTSSGAVFEGDTVVASARFDRLPAGGHVVLELETDDGEVVRQEILLDELPREASADRLSTVARVAAAMRLEQQDEAAARSTALRYRLVSPWTNWLVVAEREAGEKAEGLPELRKVPQTLAAGWGGMGTVASSPGVIMRCVSADYEGSASFNWAGGLVDASVGAGTDVPSQSQLLSLVNADPTRLRMDGAIGLLEEAGLADRFADVFDLASELGIEIDAIAAIILAGLLDGLASLADSDDARDVMAALQYEAKSAFAALKGMARSAAAMQKALRGAAECNLLKPGRAWEVEEALERLARIRELVGRFRRVLPSLDSGPRGSRLGRLDAAGKGASTFAGLWRTSRSSSS